jgi:hypothetical protein
MLIMKKIKFLLLLTFLLNVSHVHAQATIASNATVAADYLGSSAAATSFDVIFKRDAVQAGLLQALNTSFGVSALNPASTGSNNVANGVDALTSNTSGSGNTAVGNYALQENTTASGNTALGDGALILNVAGSYNTAAGGLALYSNTGSSNTAVGYSALYSDTSYYNVACGFKALYTNVGGSYNTALGYQADVSTNNLTNASAIGNSTIVTKSNTMEFGDSVVVGWGFGAAVPTATKVFIVGTGNTNGNGAYLTAGGTWTNVSDKDLKENVSSLDSKDILSRIKQLPVSKWKYKGGNEYHIGPMAQDFYKEFQVGVDNRSISTIDPAGVALIGVQELSTEIDALKETGAQQAQANTNLQQQVDDLKNTIAQMKTAMSQCCNSFSSAITSSGMVSKINPDQPTLEQNNPNPYNSTTVIRYYIPNQSSSAQILISDPTGRVLKSVAISEKNTGQIAIDAGTLSSGNYFYTLLVDGQKIDTKQMILTK